MEGKEKGMTRQHTFFCVNKERHTSASKVIEAQPKEIIIFGQKVQGWIVTTEEPVIDKIIPLDESTQGEVLHNDPE
jgi:hypothetical protein